jgi:Sulfotransferase family
MTHTFFGSATKQVGPLSRPTASASEADPNAPIVVLTYAHAGAELLTQLLSASPPVACTSATGLLPVCHEAISAWQQAQGRTGPPSALAIKSVRALATTMITIIQARDGASRWCETAYSTPDVAQTFLQIFPATQFICLHRSMREVLSEAVRAYPWGLGGTPLWAYATGHPGNNAATIAAYWTVRTQALLEFESDHPNSSLRVRYEDLAADPVRHAADIFATLGLDDSQHTVLPEPPALERSAVHDAVAGAGEPTVPTDLIPPALMARVGELHARLGFEF